MTRHTRGPWLAVWAVVFGLVTTAATARSDDGLTIITEDYPPLNYVEDKVLKGPAVEIVRAILARTGGGAEVRVLPWARGYHLLQTRPNTALFSTTRSAERENLFKWVGPLAEKRIGMFAKRDAGIRLEKLADAKRYLIGVQRAGIGMLYLKERGFTNFDPTTSALTNLKKLLGGRNDLWFSSNATVAANCARLGTGDCAIELVLPVENTLLSVAFNKDTPDDVVRRWQEAYDALVAEGAVEATFRKYGLDALYTSFR